MDFAENYSFVCQDAVHPVVVYYKDNCQSLSCKSFCMVRDEREHNAIVVHKFIHVVVDSLKDVSPSLNHIHYCSDGAASQYKNYKNFTNLLHHYTDFSVTADWNFFATSNGKSPCDGIGGTVKWLVTRACLQAPRQGQILDSEPSFSGAEKIFRALNSNL